eukprot:4312800-Amphidinium_carterae.7
MGEPPPPAKAKPKAPPPLIAGPTLPPTDYCSGKIVKYVSKYKSEGINPRTDFNMIGVSLVKIFRDPDTYGGHTPIRVNPGIKL